MSITYYPSSPQGKSSEVLSSLAPHRTGTVPQAPRPDPRNPGRHWLPPFSLVSAAVRQALSVEIKATLASHASRLCHSRSQRSSMSSADQSPTQNGPHHPFVSVPSYPQLALVTEPPGSPRIMHNGMRGSRQDVKHCLRHNAPHRSHSSQTQHKKTIHTLL